MIEIRSLRTLIWSTAITLSRHVFIHHCGQRVIGRLVAMMVVRVIWVQVDCTDRRGTADTAVLPPLPLPLPLPSPLSPRMSFVVPLGRHDTLCPSSVHIAPVVVVVRSSGGGIVLDVHGGKASLSMTRWSVRWRRLHALMVTTWSVSWRRLHALMVTMSWSVSWRRLHALMVTRWSPSWRRPGLSATTGSGCWAMGCGTRGGIPASIPECTCGGSACKPATGVGSTPSCGGCGSEEFVELWQAEVADLRPSNFTSNSDNLSSNTSFSYTQV